MFHIHLNVGYDNDDVEAYVTWLTLVMTRGACCVSQGILKILFKRD